MTKANSTAPARSSLFSTFLGGEKLRHEKARLEAFLAAFPGEYCGWSGDGGLIADSPSFRAFVIQYTHG